VGAKGRTDGGPIIAVKLGSRGGLACRAGEPIVRVAAMAIEPVDTTGAGDSFNAGFLRAWLDGADVRESLELGAVCGALSTRASGGVDGQATLAEAREALRAWSAR
jgi:sugar/nucleoside kinase (ribokinase family)